jgi:excisionase family DNA binding protein
LEKCLVSYKILLIFASKENNNMDTLIFQEKKYYSLKKAAKMYGVTLKTIHQWIKEGKLEKKKVGSATFVKEK